MMTEDVHKQVTKMEINYRKINNISFVLELDQCVQITLTGVTVTIV